MFSRGNLSHWLRLMGDNEEPEIRVFEVKRSGGSDQRVGRGGGGGDRLLMLTTLVLLSILTRRKRTGFLICRHGFSCTCNAIPDK